MDRMIRGVSKNARFILVDSTDLVREANKIHNCTPGAITTFGRFLTAGILIGATVKGDDLLTLRTETDGLVGQMLLTVNSKGDIKGYLESPGAGIENSDVKISEFLGTGILRVIKDMGLKEPYIGMSEMNSGDLAQDLAYYYYTSEQTPSVVILGVSFDETGDIEYAGGYMIQLLPDCDDFFIDKLEEKIKAIRTFTELRKGGMDLERIIKLIYEDMDIEDGEGEFLVEEYKILEEKSIQYSCNCSREKMFDKVIVIGKEEIENITSEKGSLDVECHFCGEKYKFIEEDFNF